MYFVYILRSTSKGKTYIGSTQDLEKRIKQHNQKLNISTKSVSDWRLIYSEPYETRTLATQREKFFKTGDGRKVLKLKNIIGT